MAGNKIGGQKAAATNKQRYGKDFYRNIGAEGGKAHNKGGFNDKELARRAGRIGGKKSSRSK